MGRSKQITKKPDLWSGLFFFVLGGMVCVFSAGIGLGTRLKPGPGFLPFLAGSVLSFLSIVLLVQAYVSAELGSWIIKISWGKIAVVLISLLAYGFFFGADRLYFRHLLVHGLLYGGHRIPELEEGNCCRTTFNAGSVSLV